MRTILATSVLAVVAGAAAAQTANQIGFVKSINTTYTDRMSNTTQDIDALVHFDDRDYLEWMLDPTDPTGATYKFTGMKFVIQDQVGTTLENFTVAAYNGGLGRVTRWLQEIRHNDDPLPFMEAIPTAETRQFVERVVAAMWVYQRRLGDRTQTLDAVAVGQWPVYGSQPDVDRPSVASTEGSRAED